ncbi:MAG: GNAT family N-acetyltransferase [Paracoccaceae bacterium]
MYSLSTETADDWWEVEALYDVCFAPGREALPSYRLRDGVERIVKLCLVARDPGGILAAAIRFWPVLVAGRSALLLGPIAVHPTRQSEGLGALLIGDSLERARRDVWRRVMLVGDASYYGRFGFRRLDGVIMPPPANPERVLGVALSAGAWAGVEGEVMRAPLI